MELYIEKAFIDDFYLDVNLEKPSSSQKILLNIFKEYGEVNKYMDIKVNSPQDLDDLKSSNLLIAFLTLNHPPQPVESIKDHFFNNEKHEQTLIFSQKVHDWFDDAKKKGALCFSIEDYEIKIRSIIKGCHFRIDLSQGFDGWNLLSSLNELPSNEIIISDGYIIIDKEKQKIDDNLIPMLKSIVNKNSCQIKTSLFTKELNPIRNEPLKIEEKAKKVYNKLNRVFADYNNVYKIISTANHNFNFKIHDRIILTNFIIIECGIGFNLIPSESSNSQIIVDSIFDKYTYNRMKNLKKCYYDYESHLNKIESSNFKSYPS